mmetsp:Transcript_4027/g.8956  ORF Transcript_4027/g.8956 Transcript_4027/m.8956 type:complete len:292 (+) Transcript_4027:271-1146(+)
MIPRNHLPQPLQLIILRGRDEPQASVVDPRKIGLEDRRHQRHKFAKIQGVATVGVYVGKSVSDKVLQFGLLVRVHLDAEGFEEPEYLRHLQTPPLILRIQQVKHLPQIVHLLPRVPRRPDQPQLPAPFHLHLLPVVNPDQLPEFVLVQEAVVVIVDAAGALDEEALALGGEEVPAVAEVLPEVKDLLGAQAGPGPIHPLLIKFQIRPRDSVGLLLGEHSLRRPLPLSFQEISNELKQPQQVQQEFAVRPGGCWADGVHSNANGPARVVDHVLLVRSSSRHALGGYVPDHPN